MTGSDDSQPPPPRRAKRTRGPASASSRSHPFQRAGQLPVDVARIDRDSLETHLRERDVSFTERLDFVLAPDELLRTLFVTARVVERSRGTIIYPPPSRRRT